MIRFLLDENVAPLYRSQLLKREPDIEIWKVGDIGAPTSGTLDPDILRWCEEHGFLLVTNNRVSMPAHLRDHLLAGGHIPGILELGQSMSIGDVLDELWLIWAVGQDEDFRDRITFLPIR